MSIIRRGQLLLSHPDLGNLILDFLLQSLFFISYPFLIMETHSRHYVAYTISWGQDRNVALVHTLPHEFIRKVPVSVDYSIVCLDVSIEGLVVEYTSNGPIKSVNSWIIEAKLLASQTFPEPHPVFYRGIVTQDPGMGSFTICSNAHISIDAEPKQ